MTEAMFAGVDRSRRHGQRETNRLAAGYQVEIDPQFKK